MPPAVSLKTGLRSHIRSVRRAMTSVDRDASNNALISSFLDIVRITNPTTVAAYVPLPGEPGGAGFVGALAASVPTLLLPILLPSRDLDWAVFGGDLRPGPLGLREPAGRPLGPEAVSDVDLMIVPALAVSLDGVRLGQGGGSYDRVLPRVTAPTLVPLHPGELLACVPAEPHDRRVCGAVLAGPGGYESAHLHWTKGCSMPHHWHSIGLSANDGG